MTGFTLAEYRDLWTIVTPVLAVVTTRGEIRRRDAKARQTVTTDEIKLPSAEDEATLMTKGDTDETWEQLIANGAPVAVIGQEDFVIVSMKMGSEHADTSSKLPAARADPLAAEAPRVRLFSARARKRSSSQRDGHSDDPVPAAASSSSAQSTAPAASSASASSSSSSSSSASSRKRLVTEEEVASRQRAAEAGNEAQAARDIAASLPGMLADVSRWKTFRGPPELQIEEARGLAPKKKQDHAPEGVAGQGTDVKGMEVDPPDK